MYAVGTSEDKRDHFGFEHAQSTSQFDASSLDRSPDQKYLRSAQPSQFACDPSHRSWLERLEYWCLHAPCLKSWSAVLLNPIAWAERSRIIQPVKWNHSFILIYCIPWYIPQSFWLFDGSNLWEQIPGCSSWRCCHGHEALSLARPFAQGEGQPSGFYPLVI